MFPGHLKVITAALRMHSFSCFCTSCKLKHTGCILLVCFVYIAIYLWIIVSVSSHFLVIIPQLILSIVWPWGNFWFWLLILLILFVMSVGGHLSAFLISSVTQSCLTLCDLMDCSTPGFPVLHHLQRLLRLMSIE